MFFVAEAINPSAFYVAADTWRHDQKTGWGLNKIYGTFEDEAAFVQQLLIPAPTRCFFEMIRADRPCKTYFDLEVGGGVLSPDQGARLCQQVIAEWAAWIQLPVRWPDAVKDCPRCLDPIVLNSSRPTNQGWKVSYHLVDPLLTFPCNNSVLIRQKSLRSVTSLTCKFFWRPN